MINVNGTQKNRATDNINSAQATSKFADNFMGAIGSLNGMKNGKTGGERLKSTANLVTSIMALMG